LNQEELLSLQSFPLEYQFPPHYSLTKVASLLGNSLNLTALRHFLADGWFYDLAFVDLFSGIGGFHLVVRELGGECVLAVDKNKSCAETYRLNFPETPFLLGDINDKEVQQQICQTDFDLLCAGFPCQPFSRAGKKLGKSPELTSLLAIIKKKQPPYVLLESVPHLVKNSSFNSLLATLLSQYQIRMALVNPKDLGVRQNRPRLFIFLNL
jgi:DNA (cytosine-5)-methyltransferase 1